jgi:hypothetical protein
MPVKSRAQQAYLAIHEPSVLRKWKGEGVKTSPAGLPEHVTPRPRTINAHVRRGQVWKPK